LSPVFSKKVLQEEETVQYRVVVIGLGNDAGNPGSIPVGGYTYKSICRSMYCIDEFIAYFYICLCEFFLFDHAYFFATYSAKGQNVFFCPALATLLTNEGLVQSANQRSV